MNKLDDVTRGIVLIVRKEKQLLKTGIENAKREIGKKNKEITDKQEAIKKIDMWFNTFEMCPSCWGRGYYGDISREIPMICDKCGGAGYLQQEIDGKKMEVMRE